jgi:hypothetical protein
MHVANLEQMVLVHRLVQLDQCRQAHKLRNRRLGVCRVVSKVAMC